MGMAASQARYLELTARKTNVEYEGQQINQQRMSLANESAGLFTQLMGLAVPTAPSSANYTTITYTFNTGDHACTLTGVNYIENQQYNAEVTYYYTEKTYTGMEKTRTDRGVRLVAGPPDTYWLTNGAPDGTAVNTIKLTQCSSIENANDVTALDQIVRDTGATTNLAVDYAENIENIYKYVAGGVTYYYSVTDLNNVRTAHPDGSKADLTGYYAANIDKRIDNSTNPENAYITKTDSGRYSTIRLESTGDAVLDISATPETNQNAYNDAMHEYEYQQQLYQQQVNNINAKTSIIQVQDRTLELKLRQLDTEQKALSTEMDSVKKVIDKNVESTFKTFQ